MKIVIDVVDFGSIAVGPSVDNPGNFVIEINDADEGGPVVSDLTADELDEFVRAINIVRGKGEFNHFNGHKPNCRCMKPLYRGVDIKYGSAAGEDPDG